MDRTSYLSTPADCCVNGICRGSLILNPEGITKLFRFPHPWYIHIELVRNQLQGMLLTERRESLHHTRKVQYVIDVEHELLTHGSVYVTGGGSVHADQIYSTGIA